MPTILTPKQQARVDIDRQLEACGWQVQSREQQNLFARRGVAIREFPLKTGYADYLLCVDGKAIGAVEAKKAGITLSGGCRWWKRWRRLSAPISTAPSGCGTPF